MAEPRPANDSAPIRPSLFDRAVAATRSSPMAQPAPARPRPPRPPLDRAALALAAAIVATPLVTLVGALLLTAQVRDDTAALARAAAPVVAARRDHDRAVALLRAAWTAPPLGATIEAAARVLPPDAALLRVERGATGAITLDIAAPDPDRAIAALRRDPLFATLRAAAQTRGDDGRMRVTLEPVR